MRKAVPVFLLATALAGCNWTGDERLRVDEDQLADLERSQGAPIYWVGRSFEGFPLTAAERQGNTILLVYGDCEIEDQGWFEDGGCGVPVEIQHKPITGNNPNVYRRMNGAPWGCGKPIRGAPTSRGDGINLYTGRWEITLYATSSAQTVRLAKALRPLNGPGKAGDRLSPPDIDVAWGQGCRGAVRSRG